MREQHMPSTIYLSARDILSGVAPLAVAGVAVLELVMQAY